MRDERHRFTQIHFNPVPGTNFGGSSEGQNRPGLFGDKKKRQILVVFVFQRQILAVFVSVAILGQAVWAAALVLCCFCI